MELLQIIIFSLKLFTVASVIIITIAYVTYKIKNRKKLKPYMRPSPEDSGIIVVNEPSYEELLAQSELNKRFKVVNELNKVQMDTPQSSGTYSNQVKAKYDKGFTGKSSDIYNFYSNNIEEQLHKFS